MSKQANNETVTTATKNVKKETLTSKAVVYIGPTIPGKLVKDTSFTKGIPVVAKKIIEKNPFMKEMFVELNRISDTKKKLADKNSALSIIYNKAKEVK